MLKILRGSLIDNIEEALNIEGGSIAVLNSLSFNDRRSFYVKQGKTYPFFLVPER